MAGKTSVLGINGLGRIGKLTLWHHLAHRTFGRIVVNVGREAGQSLKDVADYIGRDSTYGSLRGYLHGFRDHEVFSDLDEAAGTMRIDGTEVTVLRRSRNPRELDWARHGAELVVDATGKFLDPIVDVDHPKGSVRGHLEAGARTVIASAPFKMKDKAAPWPEDAVTAIKGINECDYDPARHRIVSAASCTTTCLAHMMKPLLDVIGAKRILTASMATVHAATGSQEVLDRLADKGARDLRKNRSTFNNIILTTTGAATTLALVLPAMKQIGFMAESVRVPTVTGSLIILAVNIQEEDGVKPLNKEAIKGIYREAAQKDPNRYLVYTDDQNVSADIVSYPRAGAIIEGHEIHTRTAEITFDASRIMGIKKEYLEDLKELTIQVPVTQTVVYGWYDNELGGYVHMLGELTKYILEHRETQNPACSTGA